MIHILLVDDTQHFYNKCVTHKVINYMQFVEADKRAKYVKRSDGFHEIPLSSSWNIGTFLYLFMEHEHRNAPRTHYFRSFYSFEIAI